MEKKEIYEKCGNEIYDVLDKKGFCMAEKVGILGSVKQALFIVSLREE